MELVKKLSKTCSLCWIDEGDLKIDPLYQRSILHSQVGWIKGKEFKEKALGVFQVSEREKTKDLNVVDGQHRLTAIRKRLHDKQPAPTRLLCIVHHNMSQQDEAALFVLLNTNKALTGSSRFRANLLYGHRPEKTIEEAAKAEGFVLDFRSPGKPSANDCDDRAIRGLHILLRCYNNCPTKLRAAFKFLKLVFGKRASDVDKQVRQGVVIYGIALFLKDQGGDAVSLAKEFNRLNYDFVAGWKDAKRKAGSENGHQRDQSTRFAEWLTGVCGNGGVKTVRKAKRQSKAA